MSAWPNKLGVKSDAGFEVQFTGRFDAEYRDAGKVMSIHVESGIHDDGAPCVIVNPDALSGIKDRCGVGAVLRLAEPFRASGGAGCCVPPAA